MRKRVMVLPLQYETNLETAYGDMVTEDAIEAMSKKIQKYLK